jgi:hypothetical protein
MLVLHHYISGIAIQSTQEVTRELIGWFIRQNILTLYTCPYIDTKKPHTTFSCLYVLAHFLGHLQCLSWSLFNFESTTITCSLLGRTDISLFQHARSRKTISAFCVELSFATDIPNQVHQSPEGECQERTDIQGVLALSLRWLPVVASIVY